jgi:hypothetical protein
MCWNDTAQTSLENVFMSHKFISLSLIALLFACGEHKSGKPSPSPIIPDATPTSAQPQPNLKGGQYAMVQAQFKGNYIGVVDGQLYNFDAAQNAGEPVQFKFANVSDASQTILATLDRRPQRIDVVNQDFVLLQRPQYQNYSSTSPLLFEQDCFLINIKTGAIWKFDEFFPEFKTLQVVQNGASKKLLFIGRKKSSNQNNGWVSLDLKNDYNYDAAGGYSNSLSVSSPRVIVSIDFSDSQQVTLRPLSSGVDQIDSYLADSQGNVLAQTASTQNNPSRTLAILQNEQSPIEVTINNASITYGSYDNRVLLDSKRNFWRFSRESNPNASGVLVKAERLTLARDLNDRPALMPLATITQALSNYSFRFDGGAWAGVYQNNNIFAFTGLLAITDTEGRTMTLLNDPKLLTGSATLAMTAVDNVNGKVLSYIGTYGSGATSMMVYDIADSAALKATVFSSEAQGIYGSVRTLTAAPTGGFNLETLDGPNVNQYHFDGINKAILTKSIRLETDNRVRVLVPVTSIL